MQAFRERATKLLSKEWNTILMFQEFDKYPSVLTVIYWAVTVVHSQTIIFDIKLWTKQYSVVTKVWQNKLPTPPPPKKKKKKKSKEKTSPIDHSHFHSIE